MSSYNILMQEIIITKSLPNIYGIQTKIVYKFN